MTDCFIANKKKFLPVFSTTLFYLLYYLVSTFKFDVQIDISAIFYDFLLQLGVSYILFFFIKAYLDFFDYSGANDGGFVCW